MLFIESQKDRVEEILSLYSRSNSKAIVMSKNLFYQIEQKLPVTIPIFVPDIAERPDFKKIDKILKIIE
ncbi:MAG: hypothetical protein ACTSPP_11625 [Candidatus Heimdallarchaeaceae archaeon]